MSLSPVARVTHGSHPRAAETHDDGSPTDASPSQPDTKKCIQIGRETYAITSQPRTSYDSIPVIDSSSPSAPKQKHTTTTPQGDNPEASINGMTSLTTIEEETHNLQMQAASTDEVWQSQRNPKRKRGFHNKEPTTMTTSQGHKDTSVKNDYSPMFGIQVGADTYALRTELGSGHIPPKKYKKPRSGSQNNQPPSNPYKARHRPS